MWFWRQVLVAILFGVSSQLRLRLTEICFAAAGTTLIWVFPWGHVFPLRAMTTSMNWGSRLEWLIAIEIVTALMVLPLFGVLYRLRRTFRWGNLCRVFFVSVMLVAAGDLPIVWRNSSHPVASRSEATWAIAWQLGWFFAILWISATIARRLTSPSKAIPT
jgi:hypothetical protein